jgi:hypothetical protein
MSIRKKDAQIEGLEIICIKAQENEKQLEIIFFLLEEERENEKPAVRH